MGFIIFGIVFFILSILLRKQNKKLYEKLYNYKLDKLHAYSKGGKKPLVIFIGGLPRIKMTRTEALEHYWNLLEMKYDVMKTFYFTTLVQSSIVSIVAVGVGILTWIW